MVQLLHFQKIKQSKYGVFKLLKLNYKNIKLLIKNKLKIIQLYL